MSLSDESYTHGVLISSDGPNVIIAIPSPGIVSVDRDKAIEIRNKLNSALAVATIRKLAAEVDECFEGE
jgi:hypothetical protein